MKPRTELFIVLVSALLTVSAAGAAAAREQDPAERLLLAARGLQMPGFEADSYWWFVSYPD